MSWEIYMITSHGSFCWLGPRWEMLLHTLSSSCSCLLPIRWAGWFGWGYMSIYQTTDLVGVVLRALIDYSRCLFWLFHRWTKSIVSSIVLSWPWGLWWLCEALYTMGWDRSRSEVATGPDRRPRSHASSGRLHTSKLVKTLLLYIYYITILYNYVLLVNWDNQSYNHTSEVASMFVSSKQAVGLQYMLHVFILCSR